MQIAGKLIRPDAELLVIESQRYDMAGMIQIPTLNQRCFRCGEHRGYVCLCTREQLQTWSANRFARSVSEPANMSPSANTANVCKCGQPARPRGSDCWKCYRERKRNA